MARATLSDDALIELVQRQTFRFFWEGGHPVSGLARDRSMTGGDPANDLVASGGSGFGIMAIIVAVERGWIGRAEALSRLDAMLRCLFAAPCYHGMYPHFLDGRTGATIPFSRKDDGGDIVETSYLLMGLLCARAYFAGDTAAERSLRDRITILWEEAEWSWYARDGHDVLFWHWSPNNGWALNHEIRGWNECLITYVLAASAPRYPIRPAAYHGGWTQCRDFTNGRNYHGIELPLGPAYGGPLFFAHYSFCGLDPRSLRDANADYWEQNTHHTLINYEYCVRNPGGHAGYGPDCWGLTASDDPAGYDAHSPSHDNGTISPTAALSSFPYAPEQALRALRHFHDDLGDRIWGRFGFVDAFNESAGWTADTFLAIDQGPIVVMIENWRSGLLWTLFMGIPEIQAGLRRLGFQSPHLA